jgi:hypothetical protein
VTVNHLMERGEGRNRSEIPELDRRIQALDEALGEVALPDLAYLFNVEAYAWAIFQRLRAELFERRSTMPKTDSEVFSILQSSGILDLVESRKLRQFCEARSLASRDLSRIDVKGVREMASDRRWIREVLLKLANR